MRRAQQRADEDVGAARLVDDGRTEPIEFLAKDARAFRERTATQVGASVDDETSGLAGGVRIDDVDEVHGWNRIR
jgi:hypothetical protein